MLTTVINSTGLILDSLFKRGKKVRFSFIDIHRMKKIKNEGKEEGGMKMITLTQTLTLKDNLKFIE